MIRFEELGDTHNSFYYSFITSDIENTLRNVSLTQKFNRNTFLFPVVTIHLPYITGRDPALFQGEATSRDDVLLAFLALFLLLLIEGIAAAFLLRTRNGNVSSFGFAVKQSVEFLREFNPRRVYATRNAPRGERLNRPLIAIAVVILILTFGIETMILFLSSPVQKSISNRTATFRIDQPYTPRWDRVFHHFGASWNRPCRSGRLQGVDPVGTSINVCMERTLIGTEPMLFERVNEPSTVIITSKLHDYGADHELTINNETEKFKVRAYFNLKDERARVMSSNGTHEHEESIIRGVHMMLISYTATAYRRETKDEDMNLDRLNNEYTFAREAERTGEGPVDVIPGFTTTARFYTTEMRGVFPRGIPAFHLAQHVFGGACVFAVTPGDTKDLFVEEGRVEDQEAVAWEVPIRYLNWFSLSLTIIILLPVLMLLRFFMQPTSTAEIAGAYVKEEAGALLSRSPIEVADYELRYIHIGGGDDSSATNSVHTELEGETDEKRKIRKRSLLWKKPSTNSQYVVGAETKDQSSQFDFEYNYTEDADVEATAGDAELSAERSQRLS